MKNKNHLLVLSLVAVLTITSGRLIGQPGGLNVIFRDSISATAESPFVYNNVILRNEDTLTRRLVLRISTPAGWRLLVAPPLTYKLRPGESTTIPLTLVRGNNATSNFVPVQLDIVSEVALETGIRQFYVRANPIADYVLTALNQTVEISPADKQLSVPFRIRNTGSSDTYYDVSYKTNLLSVEKPFRIVLSPGKDTTLSAHFNIQELGSVPFQKVYVHVSDSAGVFRSLTVDILKLQGQYKKHPSAYNTFPLEIESGVMQYDDQLNYYFAAAGDIDLKDGSLGFKYRSKTYGLFSTLERNRLTVTYNSNAWNLAAGHLTDFRHFFSYGDGGKLSYKSAGGQQYGIQAIIHDRYNPGTSADNFSAFVKYPSGKGSLLHEFLVSNDRRYKMDGYILNNEWVIAKSNALMFSLRAAGGMENYYIDTAAKQARPGWAAGYGFSFRRKVWTLSSYFQYNDDRYPGIEKGYRNQMHAIRWQKNKFFFELFYNYNRTASLLLKDTIFQSDLFSYNVEKYGFRAGTGGKRSSFSFSSGLLVQTGWNRYSVPRYQFAELLYTYRAAKGFRVSVSSTSGYADNNAVAQPVFFTNSNIDIGMPYLGIRGFYVQVPVFKNSGDKELSQYTQTLSAGPYVNFRLFKKVIVNLRYNVVRSLYDNRYVSNGSFNLMYDNRKRGMQVQFSGYVPFQESQAPSLMGQSRPYYNLMLRKKFTMPLLFKKKYHDLQVIAFDDVNINGRKDADEKTLRNVRMDINGIPFRTNEKGSVLLRNTDTGTYRLDLMNASQMRGLTPVSTGIVEVNLQKNYTVMLPFRMNKVVFGKVSVQLDPYRYTRFDLANIRITATDSAGKVFTTLTDATGAYSLNLPANLYTISLNPQVFTGNIKPVTLRFPANLVANEQAEVNFELVEKKREIRFLRQ